MLMSFDHKIYIPTAREDGSHAVEIAVCGRPSTFVEGFDSEAAADEWILARFAEATCGDALSDGVASNGAAGGICHG